MIARLAGNVSKVVQSPVVVFVVALSLRIWTLSQLLPGKAFDYFYQYNEPSRIAWTLVSGYGFSSPWPHTPLAPTAQQPPLYPFLIAVIFKLAGAYSYRSLWIAVGLNAIFSSFSAVMILRLGKRDFTPAVGVLAAWVWSCWLYETAVSVRLWESSLSALLLLIAVFLLPSLTSSSRSSPWAVFGILAGVASLTNATLLAVFPPLLLWLFLKSGPSVRPRAIVASVVLVLVLVPWTIRNVVVLHQVVAVRDNFGLELWLGNHEGVTSVYDNDFPVLNPAEYNRLGETSFMDSKREIAFRFIRHQPISFLRLSLRRIFLFWTVPRRSVWICISVAAWLGVCIALWHRDSTAVPYILVMAMFPLIYYITHVNAGYRHPIEPEILLMAASGVERLATVSRH